MNDGEARAADGGDGTGATDAGFGPLPPIAVLGAPLVFVDLEMTGLDPERDRVCEVALVRCTGRTVDESFESLVAPGVGPGAGQAIHRIDEEALASAPSFAAIGDKIWAMLDGAVLVAHGVEADVLFLRTELGRLGRTLPVRGVLDTLPLARRCFAVPSYKLGALSARLGLEHTRHHRAGDDARATMQLFWRTVEALAPASLADLGAVRVGEQQARPAILERLSAAVGTGEPLRVRYRPAGRAAEEITFVVTAVRSDVDPPRVLGYLHPGRGRHELRADRILAILPPPPPGAPVLPSA